MISGASLAFYALIGFEDSVNVARGDEGGAAHVPGHAVPRPRDRRRGLPGALINMVMASRLLYGMAQQGVIPRWLGRVHPGRQTPWAGVLLSGALAAVLVVVGDLETLADTTVLLLLFAFVAVHVAVLVLRRTPVDHEHFPRLDRVHSSRPKASRPPA